MALSELPVELRALLWEEMTLQDLIKLIRSVPIYGSEIVENVRVISGDDGGLLISSSILRNFPYLRVMKPNLQHPHLLFPHSSLREATINATGETETNHVLNTLFDGIRKITIVNGDGNQVIITGKQVEVHSRVSGVSGSLLALSPHRNKIDKIIIREERLGGLRSDTKLANLFNWAMSINVRSLEYHLPTPATIDWVYRKDIDYDFGVHLKRTSELVQVSGHNILPNRVEELIIPLRQETIVAVMGIYPGLKKVGLMILGADGYANNELRFLLESYPDLLFVVFASYIDPDGEDWRDNDQRDPAPWIRDHPRITLARQKV